MNVPLTIANIIAGEPFLMIFIMLQVARANPIVPFGVQEMLNIKGFPIQVGFSRILLLDCAAIVLPLLLRVSG